MTDQIDGKAVKIAIANLMYFGENYDCVDAIRIMGTLLSERDALQAQVEGLTSELSSVDMQLKIALAASSQNARIAEAALAREGAMFDAGVAAIEGSLQNEWDEGTEAYGPRHCFLKQRMNMGKRAAINILRSIAPADAAAALARREDEVREECAVEAERDSPLAAIRIRALKRSGKETT